MTTIAHLIEQLNKMGIQFGYTTNVRMEVLIPQLEGDLMPGECDIGKVQYQPKDKFNEARVLLVEEQ